MTPTALILTAVAVVFLIGLVAVIVERTEQRDEAIKRAARADDRAEVFADEICHVHAANEILCAELAASDQQRIVSDGIIARLRGDVLDAQMRLADALNEAAAAPAPVIPLPVVREASPYDWPVADGHFPVHTEVNDDDIEALMRATEEN
jgi:hypothetical protein